MLGVTLLTTRPGAGAQVIGIMPSGFEFPLAPSQLKPQRAFDNHEFRLNSTVSTFPLAAAPAAPLQASQRRRFGQSSGHGPRLSGLYRVSLESRPESLDSDSGSEPNRPSIFNAVSEQLGLKLDATKGHLGL